MLITIFLSHLSHLTKIQIKPQIWWVSCKSCGEQQNLFEFPINFELIYQSLLWIWSSIWYVTWSIIINLVFKRFEIERILLIKDLWGNLLCWSSTCPVPGGILLGNYSENSSDILSFCLKAFEFCLIVWMGKCLIAKFLIGKCLIG